MVCASFPTASRAARVASASCARAYGFSIGVSFGFGESRAESLRLGARGSLAVGGVLGRVGGGFVARLGAVRGAFEVALEVFDAEGELAVRALQLAAPARGRLEVEFVLGGERGLVAERLGGGVAALRGGRELGDEVVALASQRGERVVRLGEPRATLVELGGGRLVLGRGAAPGAKLVSFFFSAATDCPLAKRRAREARR